MPIKPDKPTDAPVVTKAKRKRQHPTDQNRTVSGTFKKGNCANPNGRPKQIFHTTKPWKQAIMRELLDRTDREKADYLQKAAGKLLDQIMNSPFPMSAITELGNRLDGSPEKEPAAPQQNTLQLVMNSIRVLNLTPEQRNEFAKQLATQQQLGGDGRGEYTGGNGGAARD